MTASVFTDAASAVWSLVPEGAVRPRGMKTRPGRWRSTPEELRGRLEAALAADPPQPYLVFVLNPPGARSGWRWFAPGLPMQLLDETLEFSGVEWRAGLLPVEAALAALEFGLIECRPRKGSG